MDSIIAWLGVRNFKIDDRTADGIRMRVMKQIKLARASAATGVKVREIVPAPLEFQCPTCGYTENSKSTRYKNEDQLRACHARDLLRGTLLGDAPREVKEFASKVGQTLDPNSKWW